MVGVMVNINYFFCIVVVIVFSLVFIVFDYVFVGYISFFMNMKCFLIYICLVGLGFVGRNGIGKIMLLKYMVMYVIDGILWNC